MSKHLVIPDCQVKDGVDNSFLTWIGNYIVAKKPDVVIQIGDFADMPSLSSYDAGKKSFEGRRYKTDIEAAKRGMELLLQPLRDYNSKARKNHEKLYTPRMVLTLGNHEDRISRAVENDAKLDGTIGLSDLGYETQGWEVYPFLEVVSINGVHYSHYFTSGILGRPVANARQLILKKHVSCVMGHVQHWDIHKEVRADGKAIIGLFSGSCYLHNEDYLGAQGNNYDRGLWVLHEVNDGHFFPMYVSLQFLKERYASGVVHVATSD